MEALDLRGRASGAALGRAMALMHSATPKQPEAAAGGGQGWGVGARRRLCPGARRDAGATCRPQQFQSRVRQTPVQGCVPGRSAATGQSTPSP
eukprot:225382-Chlamydomonas_euryale.AAC.1